MAQPAHPTFRCHRRQLKKVPQKHELDASKGLLALAQASSKQLQLHTQSKQKGEKGSLAGPWQVEVPNLIKVVAMKHGHLLDDQHLGCHPIVRSTWHLIAAWLQHSHELPHHAAAHTVLTCTPANELIVMPPSALAAIPVLAVQ